MKDSYVVNFKFPKGSKEQFDSAQLQTVPRIGDIICDDIPQSRRYRVSTVVFSINHETSIATTTVELENV